MLKAVAAAFSMYSIIPMPRVEWTERTMKYALCFFPLVGAVIGCAQYLLYMLLDMAGTGDFLRCALMAVVPVIISGGIHLDGFMDTSDAIGSHAGRERKLEIMKDPHTGAFAVIALVSYMLVYAGLLSELKAEATVVYSAGFFMSRSLSGAMVLIMPKAKSDGLAAAWSGMTDRRSAYILLGEAALCALVMAFMPCGLWAVSLIVALAAAQYAAFIKIFGGITGDIAGFMLQVSEIAVLAGCVIGGLL